MCSSSSSFNSSNSSLNIINVQLDIDICGILQFHVNRLTRVFSYSLCVFLELLRKVSAEVSSQWICTPQSVLSWKSSPYYKMAACYPWQQSMSSCKAIWWGDFFWLLFRSWHISKMSMQQHYHTIPGAPFSCHCPTKETYYLGMLLLAYLLPVTWSYIAFWEL